MAINPKTGKEEEEIAPPTDFDAIPGITGKPDPKPQIGGEVQVGTPQEDKSVSGEDLEKFKGFEEGQVLIPGVNVGIPGADEAVGEFTPQQDDAVVDIDEANKGDTAKIGLTRESFLDITSKLESNRTDEEKALLRRFRARRALGETSAQIFGDDVAPESEGFDTTGLETEAEASIKSIREKGQTAITAQEKAIDLKLAEQLRNVELRGQKRQATLDRSLSFSGFGRSSSALEKRDELQQSINFEMAKARAAADLEKKLFKAKQEGADSKTISAISKSLAESIKSLKETEAENAESAARLNLELGLKSDEALDNLLNSTSQGLEAKEKGFDRETSLAVGYVSDNFGNALITGPDGQPVAFSSDDAGNEVKVLNFKDGNDNTYVYKNGTLDKIIQNDGTILTGEELKTLKVPTSVIEDKKDIESSKFETQLRKEFIGRKEIENFALINSSFNKIKFGAENPSPAGDIAMVFNFMKMLDPRSTVREGEFATASNAAGVPERIRNVFNKMRRGTILGDDQRKDFLSTAEGIFDSEKKIATKVRDEYKRIADADGLRSGIIIGGFDDSISNDIPGIELDDDETTELDTLFPTNKSTGESTITSKSGKKFNINLKGLNKADQTAGTKVGLSNYGLGTVTQEFGATSPLKIDNIKLANGKIGTPGIDIDGKIGDNIPSSISGTVKIVKSNTGLGNRVIITDIQGNEHFFNHLDGFNVQDGQTIQRGDNIGTMGNSGSVIAGPGGDGSHLDYRVKSSKGWIDPKQFLNT